MIGTQRLEYMIEELLERDRENNSTIRELKQELQVQREESREALDRLDKLEDKIENQEWFCKQLKLVIFRL